MDKTWKTKAMSPTSLHLDTKNPRLGREYSDRAPRELIQYLFDHDKAFDVAESIASRGYFPNEPLLAVKEDGRYVIVEGNRRLAALKALREPGLLEGTYERKIERLVRNMGSTSLIDTVPVTIAPSRKDTDRQIAGRHIGTPVLAWRSENRASFILDKLAEGYDNDELRDVLGFSLSDIQQARQTRAVADMARSLDLPEEVKAKLEGPTAKVFTTLERVFDSSVGREYLHVNTDAEHGLKGTTSKKEFVRGFSKLVTDVALGKQSSRTLNTNDNIRTYFEGWNDEEKPKKKRSSFVPSDIITKQSVSAKPVVKKTTPKKVKSESKTIIPSSLKIRYSDERLKDIGRELKKLQRKSNPNAGAVLLRVFLELSIINCLKRVNRLDPLVDKLRKAGQLRYPMPSLSQLVDEIKDFAKSKLTGPQMDKINKALSSDKKAPFNVGDLNAFVHDSDLPGERDILQFWIRTEPLFRLMLDESLEEDNAQ
jgi:ParB-like chromosome segregation protein Spo0J